MPRRLGLLPPSPVFKRRTQSESLRQRCFLSTFNRTLHLNDAGYFHERKLLRRGWVQVHHAAGSSVDAKRCNDGSLRSRAIENVNCCEKAVALCSKVCTFRTPVVIDRGSGASDLQVGSRP
eukprot:793658-Rhodomonas_salina.1